MAEHPPIEESRDQLETRMASFIRNREPMMTTRDLANWLVREYVLLPRWRLGENELYESAGDVRVKGPTTYTEACSCGGWSAGFHRMDCGVFKENR